MKMNDRQFQLKLEAGDLSHDDILKYVIFEKNKQIDKLKKQIKDLKTAEKKKSLIKRAFDDVRERLLRSRKNKIAFTPLTYKDDWSVGEMSMIDEGSFYVWQDTTFDEFKELFVENLR